MLSWTYQSLTGWIKRAVLKGDIFHHLDSKAFLFFLMYLVPAVVRCRTQQKNSLSETAWQLLPANASVLLIYLCKFTCTYACANAWGHMHKVYLEQMALAFIGNKRSEQLHSLIPPLPWQLGTSSGHTFLRSVWIRQFPSPLLLYSLGLVYERKMFWIHQWYQLMEPIQDMQNTHRSTCIRDDLIASTYLGLI